MNKRTTFRLLLGLTFALILGLAGLVIGAKAEPAADVPQDITPDCQGCHNILREHWQEGAHGQAASDEIFLEAWEVHNKNSDCMECHTTGYDANTGEWEFDGVACIVCHTPVAENHPEDIMPTDISSRMCGDCHIDTFAEWETSVHANEELACVRCHNSHTNEIKADDVMDLCKSCHSDTVHTFAYSQHAQEGLICTDCHLHVSTTSMGEGCTDCHPDGTDPDIVADHGRKIHTFKVDLETCTSCHSEGMHAESTGMPGQDANLEQSSILGNAEEALETEPRNVSPVGFGILGALVGMAFGMLMAPWLERWYKRFDL